MYFLRVKGKFFNMDIINAHTQTEDKPEEEKVNFYEVLQTMFDGSLRNNTILLGVMNKNIGKDL